MISDLALAQASADTYGAPSAFEATFTWGDIHIGLRKTEKQRIIAFRGSVDLQDWMRDFEAAPKRHPILGYCHEGFLKGMDEIHWELRPWLIDVEGDHEVAITGHSLGAARACIYAALLTANNRAPNVLTTFGTPRPGFRQLSEILRSGNFPITHYKNGPDPVVKVPVAVPVFLPYQKPVEDTPLEVAPTDARDPFAWHSMGLYLEGVRLAALTN